MPTSNQYDTAGDDALTMSSNNSDDSPMDSEDPNGKSGGGNKKQAIHNLPQMKHQQEVIPRRPRIVRQNDVESLGKGAFRKTPGFSRIP